MSSGLTRRDLFRGGANRDARRPPWALSERSFTDACRRCGECVRVCPERLLDAGDGGFPVIEFRRGGCSFCGKCRDACPSGALRAGRPAWDLVAAVGEGCLSLHGTACRTCGEWCAEGAIRFRPMQGGRARPTVEASACTGCGACVRPCPVAAVSMRVNKGEMAACA